MMKMSMSRLSLIAWLIISTCTMVKAVTSPVDLVNPYMGNISHLLMPTFPTIHLPYGMMRVFPQRGSYVDDYVNGLPVIVVNHRENCCFNISVTGMDESRLQPVVRTDYDNEQITPYYYKTDLENQTIEAEFTPAEHAAIYRFHFLNSSAARILINSGNGEMQVASNSVSGYQNTWGGIRVYIYAEVDAIPISTGILQHNTVNRAVHTARGDNACVVMEFATGATVTLRYAVSFISVEQAKANFTAEVAHRTFEQVKDNARSCWNSELNKIIIDGGTPDYAAVFYTSLYRCMERPVCISEQGNYFCPADHEIHPDGGRPFYTDDWLWDTFRATHPLRMLIDPKREADIIHSLIRTAEHDASHRFPTFPAVTGDSRRMNCNHGVAVVADAWYKGVKNFDLAKAYDYCRAGIEQKTLAPWSSHDPSWLDTFYRDHGYIPALREGEQETVAGVNSFEKRQAVAVTLGTSYDQWCLSQIAAALHRNEEAQHYLKCSYNYRNLFNYKTSFFHPKDKDGNWIEPFDYRFSGGLGAREYYDENNGWTYRWDVMHNPADLISLMGGKEEFVKNLDCTFNEWLGKSRYEFYAQLPDQTGNVGQFTMANEPSLHIPYLYNYACVPWKTQHRVHSLIDQWFRNDLMGVPGDEDGGGLSGFVVFSMMGLYPVTPGLPVYNISSPFFDEISIAVNGSNRLHITARGAGDKAKYIGQMHLNGVSWQRPWLSHSDICNGATIVFDLTTKHTAWGSTPGNEPPSALSKP